MPLGWAMLASTVISSASSAYGAHQQGKAAAQQRKDFLGAFNEAARRMDFFHQLQTAYGNRAVAESKAGFERARELARASGESQRQGVLDREGLLSSRLMQDMTSRGLGGTTIAPNLARGLAADTQRRLQEIDTSVSGMRMGLEQASGLAGASNQWNFANMLGGQAAQSNSLFGNLMSAYANAQVGSSPVASAGQGLASMLPYLAMMGGGGGGGAPAMTGYSTPGLF